MALQLEHADAREVGLARAPAVLALLPLSFEDDEGDQCRDTEPEPRESRHPADSIRVEAEMRKRAVLGALILVAVAALALAGELAGVKMPDTDTVEGKTLKLNGMGLRKKVLFKVYVAGLYVETTSKDAAAILASGGIKSMRLHILRNLKGKQVSDAIAEGFERNSKEQLPKLQARLEKFSAMIPDVAEGDQITMTYLPDQGTKVSVRGTDRGTIEGRDFADALFAVWLGPDPVQEDLKKALLGG